MIYVKLIKDASWKSDSVKLSTMFLMRLNRIHLYFIYLIIKNSLLKKFGVHNWV